MRRGGRSDHRDRPYDGPRDGDRDGRSGPPRDRGRPGDPRPISVHIPEELAGGVIGKGGQVIGDIRNKTGARIQMDHSQRHERLGTRIVTMSGEPEQIASAESMIGEVLDRSARDKRLSNTVGIDLPLKLFVPEEAVSHIIGWESSAIREIESRSQARVDIRGKAEATRPGLRNISI